MTQPQLAIVTGGTTGIGKGIALNLAKAGWNTDIADAVLFLAGKPFTTTHPTFWRSNWIKPA